CWTFSLRAIAASATSRALISPLRISSASATASWSARTSLPNTWILLSVIRQTGPLPVNGNSAPYSRQRQARWHSANRDESATIKDKYGSLETTVFLDHVIGGGNLGGTLGGNANHFLRYPLCRQPIRMVLAHQLAVGALDLGIGGLLVEAEHLVRLRQRALRARCAGTALPVTLRTASTGK